VQRSSIKYDSLGFTLVELLVVMTIVATLLSIVAPRYFNSLERAKETALKQDLHVMRDAIGKFHSDTGSYPEVLAELVEKKYLRNIPVDPFTESAETWIPVPVPDEAGGIFDIRSGSPDQARDGTFYEAW
jgi:general secretion pathway protein G